MRLFATCLDALEQVGPVEVQDAAVFVDLEKDDLLKYEPLEFQPKAGDLLVWHARSIHKIDGPSDQVPRAVAGEVLLREMVDRAPSASEAESVAQ